MSIPFLCDGVLPITEREHDAAKTLMKIQFTAQTTPAVSPKIQSQPNTCCGKFFFTVLGYHLHMCRYHKAIYADTEQCSVCEQKFNKFSYNRHLKDGKCPTSMFANPCPYCRRKCNGLKGLYYHINKSHPEHFVKCQKGTFSRALPKQQPQIEHLSYEKDTAHMRDMRLKSIISRKLMEKRMAHVTHMSRMARLARKFDITDVSLMEKLK